MNNFALIICKTSFLFAIKPTLLLGNGSQKKPTCQRVKEQQAQLTLHPLMKHYSCISSKIYFVYNIFSLGPRMHAIHLTSSVKTEATLSLGLG